MKSPKVYIIIINWNGLKDTIECLESVLQLNYDNFKILVVDNGSSDDSYNSISGKFPEIEIIGNKSNMGFTGGNNIGIKHAMNNEADYVWLLNNDTVVGSEVLSNLISNARGYDDFGLASPVINYYDSPHCMQYCGSYIDWYKFEIVHATDVDALHQWDVGRRKNLCLWGTALLISRNLIDNIGCFDDNFFAYYEDFDFSLRSLRAGFTNMMVTEAVIQHKNPLPNATELLRSPAYYFYLTRNNMFFTYKYLNGIKKIKHLRYQVASALHNYEKMIDSDNARIADAYLDGVFNALLNKGGGWLDRIITPQAAKKILLSRASANILNLKLKYSNPPPRRE
jgi:GT2 family glycosyltransferase